MNTVIECDDCTAKFDLEFDATKIIILRESGRVQLEDAERERWGSRDFGRCPECYATTPAALLVGPMADAIEDSGILKSLEREIRYRAEGSAWKFPKGAEPSHRGMGGSGDGVEARHSDGAISGPLGILTDEDKP